MNKTAFRAAAAAACVAGVALVTAPAAQADVPPAGELFQITTQFEGRTLCVGENLNQNEVSLAFPLVTCDESVPAQQWKRSANARCIENVATARSLEGQQIMRRSCTRFASAELRWKQDPQGRVWKQDGNSISRTFWAVTNYSHGRGPALSFPGRTDGTIPDNAAVFKFVSL
ncbi:hypothetical protein [Streptomyces clavifer]|uniref:hypothetical protein n=1 Tax=Streptomyces clavifer TaxID=68188 RepID=UPI0038093D02